jgi:hypothetical protein
VSNDRIAIHIQQKGASRRAISWRRRRALYLSSGSLTESAGGGGIGSSVLESRVVDVVQLILTDHGSTLGELAGLQLHLGVVESRDLVHMPQGEDGLGEEIQDTVEDWSARGKMIRYARAYTSHNSTHSFHCQER